ncbi:MAG: phosphate propanoyltransferase [Oscillospiraceae bacterium]|nr:phosphate propanoyltransferase [Oscillospiraceae bacterium]
MKVLVETSARHVHLSKDSIKVLFGDNYNLTPKRYLSQPEQFVCAEKVEIVGLKGSIKGVSVLGPLRSKTQVEISLTDARKIGISAPIRESGDLYRTAGCEIIGPNGKYALKEGVIAAKRHIHVPLNEVKEHLFTDGQIVRVKIDSTDRSGILDDVIIRISDKFELAMHIDTDEANALGLNGNVDTYGEIILKNG